MKNSGLNFTKMYGSGNDFVVIDNRAGVLKKNLPALAVRLCNRKFGIGADGLMLVERSFSADFKMRIFNADGSEAEMCGNGSRCIASFAYKNGIAGKDMVFETLAGSISAKITGEKVRVRLGDPSETLTGIALDVSGRRLKANFTNTGVPHAVLFTKALEKTDVQGLGRLIRYHKRFAPRGTNVNFVSVIDDKTIKIRTYERGVEGEALACGTGSAAAAVISSLLGYVKPPVSVITRSGLVLKIYFRRGASGITDLFLEGDAVTVYHGKL